MGWLVLLAIAAGIGALYAWLLKGRQDREGAFMAAAGFNPRYKYDGGLLGVSLAVDPENEGVAFLWPDRKRDPTLLDFSEIMGVEVCKNGGSLQRTNRGSQAVGALVGGALFGGAGFVIGGLSGSKASIDKTTRLSLVIYSSDMDAPSAEIVFFKSSNGVTPGSLSIREKERLLNDWYGRLQGIVKQQDRLHSASVHVHIGRQDDGGRTVLDSYGRPLIR